MTKYKNGKIMKLRFEVQGLIRSIEGHLDFQKINSTRVYLKKIFTL